MISATPITDAKNRIINEAPMIKIAERMKGEKIRVSFYLLTEVHETLKTASHETGVPMSEIVSVVLRSWLIEAGYLNEQDEGDDQ